MNITRPLFATFLLLINACGGDAADHGHDHAAEGAADGAVPDQDQAHDADAGEHEHAEDPLGTVRIGDLDVELAQGHGAVAAGQEAHLVVKLPYSDSGSTIVRAWIGTEDRTLSLVGKGKYAASHDDYDVHATAPDPLPGKPAVVDRARAARRQQAPGLRQADPGVT